MAASLRFLPGQVRALRPAYRLPERDENVGMIEHKHYIYHQQNFILFNKTRKLHILLYDTLAWILYYTRYYWQKHDVFFMFGYFYAYPPS